MPITIALQIDPLHKLNQASDSSLELARAAHDAGHKLFYYEPAAMRLEVAGGTRVIAAGHELARNDHGVWQSGAAVTLDLAQMNVILMRQDPPFDMAYIAATHMLELLPASMKVVNSPVGVRNAPEKLLITHVPQLMAPTLITRDRAAIEAFRDEHRDIIIKPLFGHAGHGIFHLRDGDDNLPALVETLAAASPEPWIMQKYLPVHQAGDKRIVMLNGKPVGGLVRMPAKGDMRGTLRTGARAEKLVMTKRDHEICESLGSLLRDRGLYLVGIDVIGDYLTEINVTSPTGLVASDKLDGRTGKDRLAEQFWRGLGL